MDEISQQLCTPQIPPAGTGPHGFAIAALETHMAVLWLLDMQKLVQGCTVIVGRGFIPPAGFVHNTQLVSGDQSIH